MNRDISIYVKDILENMERAERFVVEMTYEEFVKEEVANFAVIRCIEIMGEAAKHISYESKNRKSLQHFNQR